MVAKIGTWGVIIVAMLITVSSAVLWSQAPRGRRAASRQAVPHQVATENFVTSDTCRSCHPSQYSSWHDSYHRTMAQVATPEAVAAPFDDIQLDDDALSCRLERRGDEFWATVYETNWRQRLTDAGIDPDSVIDTPQSPFVTRRIELTTGSHHMQVYWYTNNSRMIELPFYYHIDGKRWIPRDDSVLAPPVNDLTVSPSAEWREDCIKCHSTAGKPRVVSADTFESTVSEFGITCEACHGPAEEHVKFHRNPLNRYRSHISESGGDPTIINPARLSHEKSAQVCGQCHISFVPANNDFMVNGLKYRAGGDFEKSHLVQKFDPTDRWSEELMTFWGDGTCCVGGDEYLGLIESECYLNGQLSCISCHSMHQSDPNDQLAAGMNTDQACIQCHQGIGENIASHTHHAPQSSGSRCYNCHMPHTSYALFTAMRSHRIDIPDIAASAASGRPNACNLCHLDKTLQWSNEQLSQWYGTPSADLSEQQTQVAASLLWLLKGNAAQRVVTAWHMGWEHAHTASGNQWQAPHVSQLLDDPYSVVRSIAHTALKTLPGYEDHQFDYIADSQTRRAAVTGAIELWQQQNQTNNDGAGALLMDDRGMLDLKRIEAVMQQRDDTPITITE